MFPVPYLSDHSFNLSASSKDESNDNRFLVPSQVDNRLRLSPGQFHDELIAAIQTWLVRSPSLQTRDAYRRDLNRFLRYVGITVETIECLLDVQPAHISQWRDEMLASGLTNATVRRRIMVLRSLYSFLQPHGFIGTSPCHPKLVTPPAPPRDGKTPGMTVDECRRLLDAPDPSTPIGIRDRAILAVLAYSACRVGELAKLRVGDVQADGGHTVLHLLGKGGRERAVALHAEAVDRLENWLRQIEVEEAGSPLFRPVVSAHGQGRDGFRNRPLTIRSIEKLIRKHSTAIDLDSRISVHSLRVTALTLAHEQGVDLIALQAFAGHSSPNVTAGYIRRRENLDASPAHRLSY